MAEGLLRAMYEDRYEAYSAGVESKTVNPLAIVAMKEIGIDISSQYSKTPRNFKIPYLTWRSRSATGLKWLVLYAVRILSSRANLPEQEK